jgi:prophage regulatory protein
MVHLREAFALLGAPEMDCLPTEPSRSTDPLLRLPEVQRLTGLKRSAIYAQMQKGTFPRSVNVGPRAASWSEASIQAWTAGCLERQGRSNLVLTGTLRGERQRRSHEPPNRSVGRS